MHSLDGTESPCYPSAESKSPTPGQLQVASASGSRAACGRKMKAMPLESAPINFTHHFLIAMPGLSDEAFAKSVIYMCEHSDRGALGLVINKPSDINLKNLFDKVELPLHREDLSLSPVFQGGPVQTERGFVLHESMMPGSESVYASTMTIPGGLEMTTSKDVLEALSTGAGPKKIFVSLGYSSWGEGQLESEISDNSWLTVAADPAVIFDTPVEQRYDKALLLLGLQSWMLSPEAGHA
jgi:putative transcriptional regulator